MRLVDADDLRRVLAAIGRLHRDVGGVGDDVCIRQDVAVGADDEARAFAARLSAFPPRGIGWPNRGRIHRTDRSATCPVRRRVGHFLRLADDGDVDDCRSVALDERGEVRQGPARRAGGASAVCGAAACAARDSLRVSSTLRTGRSAQSERSDSNTYQDQRATMSNSKGSVQEMLSRRTKGPEVFPLQRVNRRDGG